MNRPNGVLGSLLTTFVLSVLVGIGVPLYMNVEHAMDWKKLLLVGLIGFAGFWAISFGGVAITAIVTRRSNR